MSDTEGRDDRFDWSAPEGSAQPAGSAPPWDQPAGHGYGQPQGGGWGAAAPAGPVYAHWGLRVGSLLIDWIIPTAAFFVLVVIGALISGVGDDGDGSGFGIFALLGYVGLIGFWIWNSCLRQGRTGQSVGKSVVGTKLVRAADGQYVGGGMAFVRELAHFLDGLPCYLGYLWPLWDSRRQTFSDKVCGTVVVLAR